MKRILLGVATAALAVVTIFASNFTIPLATPGTDVITVEGTPNRDISVADLRGLPCPPLCAPAPPPPPPGQEPFTLIVLPDTQNYAWQYPATLTAQANWVVANRDALNIKAVLSTGDQVQIPDSELQWQRVDAAYGLMEAAGIMTVVVCGNHDQCPASDTLMWNYFGPQRPFGDGTYGSQASWCGSIVYQSGTGKNTNRLIGTCQKILGTNFVVFSAYYMGDNGLAGKTTIEVEAGDVAPGNAKRVLRWVRDKINAEFQTNDVIVMTHADLRTPGATVPEGTRQNGYDEIVNLGYLPLSPIKFVWAGHQLGQQAEAKRITTRPDGTILNEVLSNYQDRINGGNGWLRILTVDPVGRTVFVQTYSPTLNQYETDSNSQFTISY